MVPGALAKVVLSRVVYHSLHQRRSFVQAPVSLWIVAAIVRLRRMRLGMPLLTIGTGPIKSNTPTPALPGVALIADHLLAHGNTCKHHRTRSSANVGDEDAIDQPMVAQIVFQDQRGVFDRSFASCALSDLSPQFITLREVRLRSAAWGLVRP